MGFKTVDIIEAIRADIKQELREELLAELQPEIQRQLRANIFDLREAATYLKVSTRTVQRMINTDGLPHFRQRKQLFFRQIALDRWIAKQEA
ncbi:Helix-turn-helix domain protein [compost metagenome]